VSVNLFRSLGLVGWAWRSALAAGARVSVWFPFLIIAAVQLLALGFLVSFHRPWAVPLALPLVQNAGGEEATHYPFFYYFLPMIYSRVMVVVAALVASIATGAATLLFARGFGVRLREGAWRGAWRHAPKLIAIALVSAALYYGASRLLGQVPQKMILENQLVRWSTRGAMLFAMLLIESFLAYTTAWIVLEGAGLWPAVRDSFRVTARTLLPTFILVGVAILLLYPFNYLSQRVDLFATKLAPETIAGLLLARIGFELLCGFLLVGAITRLFVWRLEATR
jgi:hypothetical protein